MVDVRLASSGPEIQSEVRFQRYGLLWRGNWHMFSLEDELLRVLEFEADPGREVLE